MSGPPVAAGFEVEAIGGKNKFKHRTCWPNSPSVQARLHAFWWMNIQEKSPKVYKSPTNTQGLNIQR